MILLRFDIDTHLGLVDRTPPLLQLLREHDLRATFFCVMGRDANLGQLVRLRLLAPRERKSPVDVKGRGGLLTILRSTLRPRQIGSGYPVLLRQMASEGHELAPHGWSHILWQRDLARIDVDRHLRKAIDALDTTLDSRVVGWASPGRSWDERVLDAIDRAGLSYAGDLDGDRPFRPHGHRHLQLPVTRFETIAQMRRRGLGDDEIVTTYVEDIASHPEYCCIYEHPDDLGADELRIFDQLFHRIASSARPVVTHREAARRWSAT